MTTIGSLFSGYGGLDLAVHMAIPDTRTVWVSDVEPGPNKILAERFPGIPNLGDITTIDWDQVEPVDILVGGSPCQDLSTAGQRAGMKPGTRSGLWESMTHAIEQLQPRLVVWENVRGALSAEAYSDSNMGFFEGLVDERTPSQRPAKEKGQPLRALGRVLGDLANLGYDAEWTTVRASDVGAPHRRERVFVIAYPHGERFGRFSGRTGGRSQEVSTTISDPPLLPTPTVGDKGGPAARGGQGYGPPLGEAVLLLPTPCAQQSGNSPDEHLRKKPGRTVVTDLAILVENDLLKTGGRLLPTPRASDGHHGGPNQRDSKGNPGLSALACQLLPTPKAGDAERIACTDWGEYAPAIRRWEHILGREAPAPTTLSAHGKPHLSPAFEEWMMGLPQGWVTDVDISRANQLRALGNGVVPQQAAYAITEIMNW